MSMQLKWEETDPLLVGFCLLAALMFGGTWGGVLWIFFPDWGLEVGAGLFVYCFLALYVHARRYDPEQARMEDEYYE